VLACHVLKPLRGRDKRLARLAEVVLDELGRVPRALAPDARPVQRLVGRGRRQLVHRLGEPVELPARRLHERAVIRTRRQRCRGALEGRQQRKVPLAAQSSQRSLPRLLSIFDEPVEERLERTAVGLIELGRLAAEMLEHHVCISRGTELPAQPRQLAANVVDPGSLEQRPGRPQHRARPPGCDPELMKLLRIVAESHSGIVGEHPRILLAQEHPQPLQTRSRGGRFLVPV
jgi:hypothetical protein